MVRKREMGGDGRERQETGERERNRPSTFQHFKSEVANGMPKGLLHVLMDEAAITIACE